MFPKVAEKIVANRPSPLVDPTAVLGPHQVALIPRLVKILLDMEHVVQVLDGVFGYVWCLLDARALDLRGGAVWRHWTRVVSRPVEHRVD